MKKRFVTGDNKSKSKTQPLTNTTTTSTIIIMPSSLCSAIFHIQKGLLNNPLSALDSCVVSKVLPIMTSMFHSQQTDTR
jgi:hypothetical protein